jgi:hypothetical protein
MDREIAKITGTYLQGAKKGLQIHNMGITYDRNIAIACLLLGSCLVYSLTLKMEAICSSKTFLKYMELQLLLVIKIFVIF